MEWFRERNDLVVLDRIRSVFKNQFFGDIEIWRLLGTNVTLNYWERSKGSATKYNAFFYFIYYFLLADFINLVKLRNCNTGSLIEKNTLFVEALSDEARVQGLWLPIVKEYESGKAVIIGEKRDIYDKYKNNYNVLVLRSFSFIKWLKSRFLIINFIIKNFNFLFYNKKVIHPLRSFDLVNIITLQINTILKFDWLIEKYNPKAFLTVWDWYDMGSAGTAAFKARGKLTFTFIHGAAGKEALKEFVPLNANYIFAWGRHNTKSLLELGVNADQILEVGCSRIKFSEHIGFKKSKPEKITILLTAVLDPCFLYDIVQIVNHFTNDYKINVRLHPSLSLDTLDRILKNLDVNFVPTHDETIEETITKADYIIVDTSTAGFDAVCLNKPVFVLDSASVKRPQDIMEDVLKYNAAIFCPSFDNFKISFNNYITKTDTQTEITKNMTKFRNDFISHYGADSARKIYTKIEEISLNQS